MSKNLFIAEKPSVAQEFAKALKYKFKREDGYLESPEAVVTWCVGHLITMSYPEAYDEKFKRWSYDTLPFLPKEFKYEVIASVKKQYGIVSKLLKRKDIQTIFVCTDSGREGEYIYRLVENMAGVKGKKRRRVWIDSQTEEEILRGIREAKDLSEYDNLCESAYLRAKEDYLMGINFSRVMTLKYGNDIKKCMNREKAVIAVGRVMTCVLGMVVERERSIREFVKTPFYKITGQFSNGNGTIEAEWHLTDSSRIQGLTHLYNLYKDNGFLRRQDAEAFLKVLCDRPVAVVSSIKREQEKKSAPLLYNLAELQNDCSRFLKISPDETLQIAQELYEKKLTTYPRTDARVLSSAVAKVISKNITGLKSYSPAASFAQEILTSGVPSDIANTRYCNDKQITDHYAIIPTGQGLNALNSLSETSARVYDMIVRRFLSIFYEPAVYYKAEMKILVTGPQTKKGEEFIFSMKVLAKEGYMKVTGVPEKERAGADQWRAISTIKYGDRINADSFSIKEGETMPPKRYNSGTLILAMENAGQLIEDEELRAQIKGSGIGTSATRAEILKKLVKIEYLSLNKKTQIITPTLFGEMIYETVALCAKQLLNPTLTASWEKGLNGVADGTIQSDEYMQKLAAFVGRRVISIKNASNSGELKNRYDSLHSFYNKSR